MKKLLALVLSLFTSVALCQSVPNGGTISPGQVWTTAQWLSAWQSKADVASPAFTGSPTISGVTIPTTASPAFTGTVTINGVNVVTTTQSGTLTNSGNFIDTNPVTYGYGAQAVAASFVANSSHIPQIMGTFGTPSAQASYPSRDSVTVYEDNTAPAPAANAVAGTFTTTTFTPTVAFSAGTMAKFILGMNIITNDATYYSGILTAWAGDGSSLTVSGWFQQGNTSAGQTPAGSTATIGATTKIWARNTNVLFPPSGSIATAGVGDECGVQDLSATSATNITWCFDAVNLTANPARVAHIARGAWDYGFEATTTGTGGFYVPASASVAAGFISSQTSGTAFLANGNPGAAFSSSQTTGNVFRSTGTLVSGNYFTSLMLNVNFNGQVDIGNQSSASTSPIVMHSSGHAGGDASISVTSGTGASDGTLSVSAGNVTLSALNSTPIGATTASSGAFTTLSASSTVSGTGFSTYLASPPAIGGTVAAAGSFTALTATTGAINLNNVLTIGAGAGSVQVKAPFISAGTVFAIASGTGTCAATSTKVGGVQAGQFLCTTAGTAASTVTLTLSPTLNAYACWGRDASTATTVTQTGAVSTTAVTLTLVSVTSNDVIQFGCIGY